MRPFYSLFINSKNNGSELNFHTLSEEGNRFPVTLRQCRTHTPTLWYYAQYPAEYWKVRGCGRISCAIEKRLLLVCFFKGLYAVTGEATQVKVKKRSGRGNFKPKDH